VRVHKLAGKAAVGRQEAGRRGQVFCLLGGLGLTSQLLRQAGLKEYSNTKYEVRVLY
jgi:hypothetical protein